jgi:hypothetical protein
VLVAALVDTGPHGTGHPSPAGAGEAHYDIRGKRGTAPIAQLDIELFFFEPFAGRIWVLRHEVMSALHCRHNTKWFPGALTRT